PEGLGEEPGRPLRHGPGAGRRPAPFPGGPADYGPAADPAPPAPEMARRHKPVVVSGVATLAFALMTTVVAGLLSIVGVEPASEGEKAQRQKAEKAKREEKNQRRVAERDRDAARTALYPAQLHLARLAWDSAEIDQIQRFLENYKPKPGRADPRGWEWYYLRALCNRELYIPTIRRTDPERTGPYSPLDFAWSPDGRQLATVGDLPLLAPPGGPVRGMVGVVGTVRVHDGLTGKELFALPRHGQRPRIVAW